MGFFSVAKVLNPDYLTHMATLREIKDFSRRVADEFRPDRILLFGSHAHGRATKDSDVDLLVVMKHEGKSWRTATEIRRRVHPPFPLDLLVRTPEQLQQRLAMGDCFLKEITEKGMVLYEALDR